MPARASTGAHRGAPKRQTRNNRSAALVSRFSKVEGRRHSLPLFWGGLGRGVAPPYGRDARGPLFARIGATPHPCLPPQGGKENASNLADAGY